MGVNLFEQLLELALADEDQRLEWLNVPDIVPVVNMSLSTKVLQQVSE
jgi:hypothetical protein